MGRGCLVTSTLTLTKGEGVESFDVEAIGRRVGVEVEALGVMVSGRKALPVADDAGRMEVCRGVEI